MTYRFWLLAQTVQNFNLYSSTPPLSPSWAGVGAAGTAATVAAALAASIFSNKIQGLVYVHRDEIKSYCPEGSAHAQMVEAEQMSVHLNSNSLGQ